MPCSNDEHACCDEAIPSVTRAMVVTERDRRANPEHSVSGPSRRKLVFLTMRASQVEGRSTIFVDRDGQNGVLEEDLDFVRIYREPRRV
jgi:hypothetical protein